MQKFLVCYEIKMYNSPLCYAEVEARSKDEAILIVFARPDVVRVIACEYEDKL